MTRWRIDPAALHFAAGLLLGALIVAAVLLAA